MKPFVYVLSSFLILLGCSGKLSQEEVRQIHLEFLRDQAPFRNDGLEVTDYKLQAFSKVDRGVVDSFILAEEYKAKIQQLEENRDSLNRQVAICYETRFKTHPEEAAREAKQLGDQIKVTDAMMDELESKINQPATSVGTELYMARFSLKGAQGKAKNTPFQDSGYVFIDDQRGLVKCLSTLPEISKAL